MLASLSLSPAKAAAALTIGLLFGTMSILLTAQDRWIAGVFLSFSLCWASVVDWDRHILPDAITLGLVVIGLSDAAAAGPAALAARTVGAGAGYAVFVLIATAFRKVRRKAGLGLGDAKLLAASGAWLGWTTLSYVVLVASAAALFVIILLSTIGRFARDRDRIAFGPYLALATYVAWVLQGSGLLT